MHLFSPPTRTMKPRFPHASHSRRLHGNEAKLGSMKNLRSALIVISTTLALLSSLIAAHTLTNSLLETYYSDELSSAALFAVEGRKLQNNPSPLRSNSIDETIAKLSRQQKTRQEESIRLPTIMRRNVVSDPQPVSRTKKEIAWLMSFPNRYEFHMRFKVLFFLSFVNQPLTQHLSPFSSLQWNILYHSHDTRSNELHDCNELCTRRRDQG